MVMVLSFLDSLMPLETEEPFGRVMILILLFLSFIFKCNRNKVH